MKAVCDTKATNNLYDDALPEYYEFGFRYLEIMRDCIGDWVLFRQPRSDNGDMRYFAIAIVEEIVGPSPDGMFRAKLLDYGTFGDRVSWRTGSGRYREEALNAVTPRDRIGYFLEGRSVRPISEEDFAEISRIGFDLRDPDEEVEFHQPILDFDRLRKASPGSRAIRDKAFSRAVIRAYHCRCAVTGLAIKVGSKYEVQAAHIWSVADGGPDAVQNGLALSATAHWLLDNGLISLRDDLSLKIRKALLPDAYVTLIGERQKRIILPQNESLRPHVEYIKRNKFYRR